MGSFEKGLQLYGGIPGIKQHFGLVEDPWSCHLRKAQNVEWMNGVIGCLMVSMGKPYLFGKSLSFSKVTFFVTHYCRQGSPTIIGFYWE